MNTSPNRPSLTAHSSRTNRRILAALLLAALALAVIAGSALAANLVKNGSFENKGSNGVPKNWIRNADISAHKRTCKKSYAGECSFQFVATGAANTLHQTIDASGSTGDHINVSVWFKAKDLTWPGGTPFPYTINLFKDDGLVQSSGPSSPAMVGTYPARSQDH